MRLEASASRVAEAHGVGCRVSEVQRTARGVAFRILGCGWRLNEHVELRNLWPWPVQEFQNGSYGRLRHRFRNPSQPTLTPFKPPTKQGPMLEPAAILKNQPFPMLTNPIDFGRSPYRLAGFGAA